MQPLKHRESASRPRPTDPRIQQAKGLGLELRNLLKANDPSDRQVEAQRNATRKAYLQVVFSSPSLTSSSLALLSSTRTSSSTLATNSVAFEALNLLWLETTHVVIALYRSKLARMDKQIAENPKPPSRKAAASSSNRRGGNDGNVQYARPPGSALNPAASSSAVGPVARRKLLQQFQKLLSDEHEFWKIIVNRLASRLSPAEQLELRPLGIIATQYDDTNTSSPPDAGEDQISPDEKKRRRLEVLPLVHKTLICYGDLERYIEYNSDSPTPTTRDGGSKRRGGKKHDSSRGATSAIKTYSRAAECYRQANLLLPDDGNSHNQLAVLAQYASDPLASTYHYYRALTSRIPFTTAFKNLNIAYSKTLQQYDFEGQRRRDALTNDDLDQAGEVKRFRSAFLALHGAFFTKTKLTELASLMTRVDETFATCTRDRLIVSDGVLKIIVTSLCALWHARLSRSKSLSDHSTLCGSSRPKSTSLALTTDATASVNNSNSRAASSNPDPGGDSAAGARGGGGGGPKLEAHILIHVLQLYTTLLSASSVETNEILTSRAAASASSSSSSRSSSPRLDAHDPPAVADHDGLGLGGGGGGSKDRRSHPGHEANISAVLRRSAPALRVLGRWLRGQLDYVERVEKRVADREKKRFRATTRTSGGTSSFEEAQRSLDSSGGKGGGGGGGGLPGEDPASATGEFVVSSEQLGSTLDRFWQAFADFANSIKLAFPEDAGSPLPVLDDGVWLEEDVECLGFSPLKRRNATQGDSSNAREGARRVGRDVHPNQEVLMRIEEAHRLAEEMVDAPFARLALTEGAYVFTPPQDVFLAEEHEEPGDEVANEDVDMGDRGEASEEDDVDMRDQSTEDDPIDRAMRTAANQLELDGVEVEEDSEEDEGEDEEQIVFSGSRNSSQVQAPPAVPPGFPPRQDSFSSRSPNRSSMVTAADLRQQLFAGSSPIQPVPDAATPTRTTARPPASSQTHSPSLPAPSSGTSSPNALSSIWGAPPPPAQYHAPSSNLSGASLPSSHSNSRMTAHSFESIPNLTHNAFAAHQQHLSAAGPPGPSQYFGGHPAFSSPPVPVQPVRLSQPPAFSHRAPEYSRTYSLPPPTTAPVPSSAHPPPPLPSFHPPGLSTAHVGLNHHHGSVGPFGASSSSSVRTNSNARAAAGFPSPLPPPSTREPTREGGWPIHLGTIQRGS